MKYFLGIDNGGTMVKAGIFDSLGREIAVCSHKVEVLQPEHGWEEVDMSTLFASNVAAIKGAIERAGIDSAQIAAVACTGHGNGLYMMAEDGTGLKGIRSTDTRAREYIEQWNAEKTLDRVIDKTMQATWPAQPNALLRWFRDHDPQTLAKTCWLFMVKDYIRFCLTGQPYMELTDASATSLINNRTGDYDDEVLQTWGVAEYRSKLPPIVATTQICGQVTEQAAALTGLKAGTPVAGGMFDIDAIGLAVGMVDDQSLCLISGTWGNNQYISRTPVVSTDIFMTTCYSIPGYYLMLEGSATSASNLEWFISKFFQADKQLLAQQNASGSIYTLVDELISQADPFSSGLIFLPYLYASPVSLDAKGCFYGLDAWQDRGHVLRAMCEGIIFGHYWHIERLLKFRTMPNPILLAGGAAKSSVWSQMFADIFQTVVQIPDGTELGTLGAAIAAAVAVGEYPDCETACRNMVRFSRTYQPDPAKAELYAKKYLRFKKLIEIFQSHWEELAWKKD